MVGGASRGGKNGGDGKERGNQNLSYERIKPHNSRLKGKRYRDGSELWRKCPKNL